MGDPGSFQFKLAYRIDEAVKASGLGRTFIYEHIAKGALQSIKVGGRRLILHDELVQFLTRASEDKKACKTADEPRPEKEKRTLV